MPAAPLPLDDQARVAALRALDVLDTPHEERFDRITRMARAMLDAPVAVVGLVDADRVWPKASAGLVAMQTPRSLSFCSHAILTDALLEVPDARLDPRFADHPLVVGEPHLRFYAAQPLTTPDGHRVGVLCVVDWRPRTLDEKERAILADLAAIAADELAKVELMRAVRRAEAASQAENVFLGNMSHELRTPLNAIIGYSELLTEDEALREAPGALTDLARIRGAAAQLLTMITGLLDTAESDRRSRT